MKVLEKIPQMDDNELSRLFANAIDLISRDKQVEQALKVKKAIQVEWKSRLEAFHSGNYKADTPDVGILKTIGYRVGNDGLPEHKRRILIDYVLSEILPPVGSPAYMAEWGEPETAERYRKAHRVIRVLASSAKTLGNQDKAASDWEADLAYMEQAWGHLKYGG